MKKKLLSMVLAMTMLFTLFTVSAWAATSYTTAASDTAAYLKGVTPAVYGAEWQVLGMARAGYDADEYYEDYKKSLRGELESKGGVLSAANSAKAVMTLTALGEDPTDFAGYNIIKGMSNYDEASGDIYTLSYVMMAFNCGKYTPVTENVANPINMDKLIEAAMGHYDRQTGAWGYNDWQSGDFIADVDTTAMVVQALAPYYDRQEVKEAIDSAVDLLAAQQKDNGTYEAWGSDASESASQIAIALTELGKDPNTDSRFVKQGKGLVDMIMSNYYVDGGGFKHAMSGDVDRFASYQGLYAVVSYDRFVKGENSFYDMTDAQVKSPEKQPEKPDDPDKTNEDNQADADEKKIDSPETGDESVLLPLILIIAMSAAGAATLAYKREER